MWWFVGGDKFSRGTGVPPFLLAADRLMGRVGAHDRGPEGESCKNRPSAL